jgi:hypothetical protein
MSGMTSQMPVPDGDSQRPGPAALLGELRALRDRTSAAARAYWLPLVLFGLLICGSLPFYERLRLPATSRPTTPPGCTAGQPCHITTGPHLVITKVTALGYYWQIAIVVGVLLTVLWYRWRGDRTGLRTPARGFLITGLVLGELVLLVPLLIGQSSVTATGPLHYIGHVGSLIIIAVLLWVLAWAERSRALAIITACYFIAVLAVSPVTHGGITGGTTGAPDLALGPVRLIGLVPALILLVAGAGAWLTTRSAASRADAEG